MATTRKPTQQLWPPIPAVTYTNGATHWQVRHPANGMPTSEVFTTTAAADPAARGEWRLDRLAPFFACPRPATQAPSA